MNISAKNYKLISCVLFASFVFAPVGRTSAGGSERGAQQSVASAIRVAPPAPVFDDNARRAELAARRNKIAERIGAKGALVLLSTAPRIYTNDVNYKFRQENNFYYLTNLNQPEAKLVLLPGGANVREILFLPRRNPSQETWTGRMYSPEEAARLSSIGEIWEETEFEPFMQALRSRQAYRPQPEKILLSSRTTTPPTSGAASDAANYETLFAAAAKSEAALFMLTSTNANAQNAESREYRAEQLLAAAWRKEPNGFTVQSAFPIFAEMRLRKSEMEMRLLQHAVDITTEALGRAMAVANRARWEYEIEAEVQYTFKRRNADNWGYPPIVGCGANATTLHYEESQGRVAAGDLILMDVGAEYNHYTADVTRTFPINGKFTPAQTDIYNLVLAAQTAAYAPVKPGGTFAQVNAAAVETIKRGLLKLGLITDVNSNQHRIWFMHGTSHWLGMNVHDVGSNATKFEPGMVFTIEPGVYIRPDALDYLPKTVENERFIQAVRPAFEKYKNIGVRIEDDVVVTADGYRNLTSALPRATNEIEDFVRRASQELRAARMTKRKDETAKLNR
ncbi:MAG: aminopeptidase P family protein [Pyrinomonadaceae bacterium]